MIRIYQNWLVRAIEHCCACLGKLALSFSKILIYIFWATDKQFFQIPAPCWNTQRPHLPCYAQSEVLGRELGPWEAAKTKLSKPSSSAPEAEGAKRIPGEIRRSENRPGPRGRSASPFGQGEPAERMIFVGSGLPTFGKKVFFNKVPLLSSHHLEHNDMFSTQQIPSKSPPKSLGASTLFDHDSCDHGRQRDRTEPDSSGRPNPEAPANGPTQ